jgi:DNA-binding transcriptional ArsR family regulator
MPRRNGSGIDLLADPTRRRIIALLALGHMRPSKVAAEIGLSRPATTRQLKLLQRAGLVAARRAYTDGRAVVYYIEPVRLGQITAWLAGTEVGRAFPAAPAYPSPVRQVPDTADRSA